MSRPSRPQSRQYPVTAWSAINALGLDTKTTLAALDAGESGLAPPPLPLPFETVCGAVPGPLPEPPSRLADLDSRNSRIAMVAIDELAGALGDARRRWGAERIGLAIGSTTAAMAEAESAFARHHRTGALPPGFDLQANASHEALLLFAADIAGVSGPCVVVSTACSSSAKVFGTAQRWIDAGIVDAALVGGVDSLCHMTLRGFQALAVLSPHATRPFSSDRSGINIGEGAAFCLVEREGDGPRLLGIGESADAHHMAAPDPEGVGARLAMDAALLDAGLEGAAVDCVNAHGTGTEQNDAMEARAIRASLGAETSAYVLSTKAYTGHLLGAAGATEAVFCLHALASKDAPIPASLGCGPVDPTLGLRIPEAPVAEPVRTVLSNSFAFGGSNASVLFGAPR